MYLQLLRNRDPHVLPWDFPPFLTASHSNPPDELHESHATHHIGTWVCAAHLECSSSITNHMQHTRGSHMQGHRAPHVRPQGPQPSFPLASLPTNNSEFSSHYPSSSFSSSLPPAVRFRRESLVGSHTHIQTTSLSLSFSLSASSTIIRQPGAVCGRSLRAQSRYAWRCVCRGVCVRGTTEPEHVPPPPENTEAHPPLTQPQQPTNKSQSNPRTRKGNPAAWYVTDRC